MFEHYFILVVNNYIRSSDSFICFQAEIEQKTQLLLQGHQHYNSEGQKAVGLAKMGNRQSRHLLIVKKIFECGRCS